MTIRFATPADAPAIHAMIRALAEYEREPNAVEVTVVQLREQLASPTPPFECLVAEIDGKLVGYAVFYTTYSTWRGLPGAFVEDLFVDPAFRRRKIGFSLLARVARIVFDRGWARLEWNVLYWNASAIAFYESFGAKKLGEWVPFRVDRDALETLARAGELPEGP